MKNQRVFLYAGFAAVVLLSCGKSDSPGISRTVSSEPSAPAQTSLSQGMALRVNSSFCLAEKNDAEEITSIRWNDTIVLGERVAVLGDSATYTYAGDKAEYEFTPIMRDGGKTGFMFSSQLAPAGNLAVVIDERAVLYSGARNTDALSTILPLKTVLVTYPETERDGFVQFQAYDAERQRNYRTNFIKTQSLTFSNDDVQSVILLHTAEVLGPAEAIRKEALLEAAYNDYPGSAFAAEIRGLLSGKAIQPSSLGSLWVNDHDVNVRDNPDEKGGRIISQLSLDTEVKVSEETSESYTVDGRTGRWYHITSPVDGWVFGAFLGQ
ncbi:MAG: SH3 domain-containing protein [Spirochaetaceae bacterium]|jgi:hypothetical protein|nr:SH3 domain-containing protein [Spirochaetaceae bacterium]